MARGLLLATLLVLAANTAAGAASGAAEALSTASSAFAKIDDYRMTIAVHETAGGRVEDRTYSVLFKKPSLERVDVTAGPGKGGGIVWLGGDKVKAHRGGFLSGLHVTMDLHNSQVTTLRGDAVDTATIPSMLDDFSPTKGTISASPGPQIDGSETTAITLTVAQPASPGDVSRIVLYLSNTTHLPVRRERYAGTQLVKSENITAMQTNVGLTASDFPW
jgi:outer membrane lipoprotein-sorting protein